MKTLIAIVAAWTLMQVDVGGMSHNRWLSARYVSLNAGTSARYGSFVKHGTLVVEVAARGRAKVSGLQVGDIIVRVDKKLIRNKADLDNVLASIDATSGHRFHVYRQHDGEYYALIVLIREQPEERASSGTGADDQSAIGPVYSAVSLKGLQGIDVLVEELSSDLKDAGLSRTQLEDVVKDALKQEGLHVIDESEAYLYVFISGFRHRREGDDGMNQYSYAIDFSLRQPVRLRSDPSIVVTGATTWQPMGKMGTRLEDTLRQGLIDVTEEMTRQFISAYRQANP